MAQFLQTSVLLDKSNSFLNIWVVKLKVSIACEKDIWAETPEHRASIYCEHRHTSLLTSPNVNGWFGDFAYLFWSEKKELGLLWPWKSAEIPFFLLEPLHRPMQKHGIQLNRHIAIISGGNVKLTNASPFFKFNLSAKTVRNVYCVPGSTLLVKDPAENVSMLLISMRNYPKNCLKNSSQIFSKTS